VREDLRDVEAIQLWAQSVPEGDRHRSTLAKTFAFLCVSTKSELYSFNDMDAKPSSLDDRALGAVLGALTGDAAGAVLEFVADPITEGDVARALEMPGGGTWSVAPGQITDDGELTMSLLHALTDEPEKPLEAAALSYASWVASEPFDIGATTARSLGCLRRPELAQLADEKGAHVAMTLAAKMKTMESKANGALMRATPLAVWGVSRELVTTARAAADDCSLSHPNPACVDAGVAYVLALRHLITNAGDAEGAVALAFDVVAARGNEEVLGWLHDARDNVAVPYSPLDGFVRIAFTHAFRHLALGTSYVAALRETLFGGGDTDTNACIVGGLLGARFGASAIPRAMQDAVLGCDTTKGSHPRPERLHPRVVPALVRRLLSSA